MAKRITIPEAANRLGVKRATLYAWARDKRIETHTMLGVYYLLETEIDDIKKDLANIKPKRGRPTGKPTTRKVDAKAIKAERRAIALKAIENIDKHESVTHTTPITTSHKRKDYELSTDNFDVD